MIKILQIAQTTMKVKNKLSIIRLSFTEDNLNQPVILKIDSEDQKMTAILMPCRYDFEENSPENV